MVSMHTFYCEDPSSNPGEVNSLYYVKLVESNENKQKEAGTTHLNFKVLPLVVTFVHVKMVAGIQPMLSLNSHKSGKV